MTHGWNSAVRAADVRSLPSPGFNAVPSEPRRTENSGGLREGAEASDLLVLMIGVPLSVAASIWVVRQPSIYRAITQIEIGPPQYDPVLTTLISKDFGRRDAESNDRYLPNRVNRLKGKALAERVVNDPGYLQGPANADGDAADELVANLTARTIVNSNWVVVSLEGTDPGRTAKQLNLLLETFEHQAKDEGENGNQAILVWAKDNLEKLERELKEKIDAPLADLAENSNAIGPEGKNVFQGQLENLAAELTHKRMRFSEFQQQTWVSQLVPNSRPARRRFTPGTDR